jgi:GH35 family endo-1,4-beta-xylanase
MTQTPVENSPSIVATRRKQGFYFQWFLISVLFALVQIPWAGYQLGVGNQGIQIPFLEALHNPALFHNDLMVSDTLGSYPSYFFHICAKLLSFTTLPTLYLFLHLLTTAAVFWSVAVLSLSIVRDGRVALLTMLMLLAGQHQALAGETLYSAGFTHTWAVFPLSLLALALFYREMYIEAFALAGVIFNLHALEAGHLVAVMGFVALCRIRSFGLPRLVLVTAIFVLAALPTLLMMVHQHQQFDAEWLQLMHIRSADHSFPSTWWQVGSPDIPRYLCFLSLAAVAMGYRLRPASRRKTLLIAAGIGLLFVAGTVFTELWPIATVVRAQFFRSSRLLMVIALIVIAHGCVAAWELPWRRRGGLKGWQKGLEFGSAVFTGMTIALPPLLALLPWAVVLSVVVAVISGRLAWHQALVAGTTIVVCLVAWQMIHFAIPGLPPAFSWGSLVEWHGPSAVGWLLLGAGGALWVLSRRPLRTSTRRMLAGGGALVVGITAVLLFGKMEAGAGGRVSPWVDVQRWAEAHTPVDALFLTPAQQPGFRIYSQRAIVGEMRDGTQLYFKADFAKPWWGRMTALQPGILPDVDGKSLLAPGKQLDRLDDAQVIAVAGQYKAQYVVLPHSDERTLEKVYDNKVWAVYRPQVAVLSMESHGTELPAEDQFLRETALPNIEKNRKSDVRIQIVDGSGRPIDSVAYKVTQTGSAFDFGCSLPFFARPEVDTQSDYKPPAVKPEELSRFLEVFNYSVIPFSSQWRFLEPLRGKPDYRDLDAYVAWCDEHHVAEEFHFVAGYQPAWFKALAGSEQARVMTTHAVDLAKRYGSRIRDWEVSADGIGVDRAGALIAEIRKAAPGARLGIADDPRLGPPARASDASVYAGLEDLQKLKKGGAQVDFFAIEARRPIGLWASGKRVYEVLDAFANEGVPVHITEFGIPVGARIEGDVKQGAWTEQERAEYYERFFTICFSHPGVEAINIMGIGPDTWLDGQGLLDEKYQPTPAFEVLKRLITQRWRSSASGTLGLDGRIAFRGFHGTYEIALSLPNGRTATSSFRLDPEHPARLRMKLDAAGGTLTSVEGGGE